MEKRFGKLATRWAAGFAVALAGFGGNASATLLDRGPDMVYDTVLDITWVRDASLCVTLNNCVNRNDTLVTGGMRWSDANQWAADLVFGGFSDWRLAFASVSAGAGPTTTVAECSTVTEPFCRDNEMGYMFYYNLDGNFGEDKRGNQTAVGGEMLTGIEHFYWSGTEFETFIAWEFNFFFGSQFNFDAFSNFSAWAVRDGDVGTISVPESASLLLFGVGALGLALSRRRGRRR